MLQTLTRALRHGGKIETSLTGWIVVLSTILIVFVIIWFLTREKK